VLSSRRLVAVQLTACNRAVACQVLEVAKLPSSALIAGVQALAGWLLVSVQMPAVM
jgi:hypothetical protein